MGQSKTPTSEALNKICCCFTSGSIAGVIIACLLYIFYANNLQQLWQSSPTLPQANIKQPYFLYQHMVWGGLFGLSFLIPILKGKTFYRGILLAIFPLAATLIFFLPTNSNTNFTNYNYWLSYSTALAIILALCWGLCTSYLYKFSRK